MRAWTRRTTSHFFQGGAALSTPLDRLRDALADRYRIERELGRGGMATVYLAEDLKHHRQVAIKVIHPEVAAAIGHDRFLREIQIAANLNHPHLVPLFDSGMADDQLYYVMPYIAGESLRARLNREGQLPVETSLRLAREIASALGYSHHRGIVHRDIKPENILLSGDIALVADFGIARVSGPLASAGVTQAATQSGTTLGTPAYMSPEQAAGHALDGRSDLYSLGCVLYEMLAGRPPFVDPPGLDSSAEGLQARPRALSGRKFALASAVDAVVERALQPAAADRYPTATVFADALARLEKTTDGPGGTTTSLAGAGLVEPRDPKLISRRMTGRSWLTAGLIVGLVVIVVLLARGVLPGRGDSPPDPRRPATPKAWTLLSRFDGPPDDPGLARGAREIVRSVLDQSRFIATVPDDGVRLALTSSGLPETTSVTGAMARDLARRGLARTVVEGSIHRVGSRLSIVLRAVDAYRDSVLLTVGPKITSEEKLATTLQELGIQLERGMGDRRDRIRRGIYSTGGALQITTSFAAARALQGANRLNSEGDVLGSRRKIEEALRLDPDYAIAWRSLGVCFLNLSLEDSARWAFSEALKRKDRLPEGQRLRLQADLVILNDGSAAAIPVYLEFLRLHPDQGGAHEILAAILWELGRDEEALAHVRMAGQLSPVGPYPNTNQLETYVLLSLGRTAEAATIVESRMSGLLQLEARAALACALDDWPAFESHLAILQALPDQAANRRVSWEFDHACAQMARGSYRSGRETLERARVLAESSGLADQVHLAAVSSACAALIAGMNARDRAAPVTDPSTRGRVIAGFDALARGDAETAKERLEEVHRSSPPERTRVASSSRVLEAWIAVHEARWKDVIAIGSPLALGRERDLLFPPGRPLAGWLVGLAHEAIGHADSAAFHYERALSPIGKTRDELVARGLVVPVLRSRLVQLYARQGRFDRVQRHWEALRREMDMPDPDMRRMRESARRAVASNESSNPGGDPR